MRKAPGTALRRAVGKIAPALLLILCCGYLDPCARAAQDQPPAGGGVVSEYHTPLAGEPGKASFFGQPVVIPPQDRRFVTSVTLGGSILLPSQGGTAGLPLAALYLRRIGEESRLRAVVGVFVNELEYDRSWGPWELVAHFENYTLPGGRTEVAANREVTSTSLGWGSFVGSLGPGFRTPVAPFQEDNDFRLQLLGRVGYFYAGRTGDTGPDVVVPPDTLLYGARLRGRYDSMRRNLLELPHRGIALGWDLDYLDRERWRELSSASAASAASNHGHYLQVSGYVMGAGGIPGLSERDRVLVNLYGGTTNEQRGDRFNAFRINGGPFPSEVDDIARPHYGGILYDDVLCTAYAVGSVAYRRELTFFLYLTVAGSYIRADRATVVNADQVVFRDKTGSALTVSLDSAFFLNSELYLAYCRESGFIRDGKPGNGLILVWSKSF